MREKGVRVAIDDFGTGYSSLSYLRKFPVDALKIDQSFVRQISIARDDTAIVTTVIHMARSLKLRVVAEGVETPEEAAFLRDQQCDEAQGYYFSPPVLPQLFASLLRTGILERGVDPREVVAEDHLPLGTVRDREQGAHRPDKAARVLLTAIAKDPDAVTLALES